MTHSTVGKWAEDKLDRLRKYLAAYAAILSKQVAKGRFKGFYFVDAFAGPGKHAIRGDAQNSLQQVFGEFVETVARDKGQQRFIAGSPRIALETNPPFSRYVFIEKSVARSAELSKLRAEFSNYDVHIESVDCNEYLLNKLSNPRVNWNRHRAVIFLDPFGMQVTWATIQRLAATKAVEVLINFPEAMAIQRLLLRSGEFSAPQQAKLDEYFGTHEWYDLLYKQQATLFGDTRIEKAQQAGKKLVRWYRKRLEKEFGFASKAALIRNSRNGPLYYLILASPNRTGVKIADYILSAGEYTT
jgi:three-Cys-motif partner protein